jgi:hypothetical protein
MVYLSLNKSDEDVQSFINKIKNVFHFNEEEDENGNDMNLNKFDIIELSEFILLPFSSSPSCFI